MEGMASGVFLAGVGIYAICPRLPVGLMIPAIELAGFLWICGVLIAITGIASALAGVWWWVKHRKER